MGPKKDFNHTQGCSNSICIVHNQLKFEQEGISLDLFIRIKHLNHCINSFSYLAIPRLILKFQHHTLVINHMITDFLVP